MKTYLKYDHDKVGKSLLKFLLEKEKVTYTILDTGQLELKGNIDTKRRDEIIAVLAAHGIYFLEDKKTALVQRIRDTITEMIHDEDIVRKHKVSVYLSKKLGYSYTYLSTLFSESTYTSIENFIILKKIDYAKTLLAQGDLSLTDIAFKLNYSSVAHLSGQFKKATGITPSQFQRILKKRTQQLTDT
ncbi:AraC family transcriptional regulator [Allomuricauda sp. d1]|uniref:helix-turn-helix domain-containing protein n=1 Tax=Allomuricauda sp. d1 TaxID=3136725 RepID=UPI0031DFD288